MTKLEQIKTAILERYENGEITLDQASAVYEAAEAKYATEGKKCDDAECEDGECEDGECAEEDKPKKKKLKAKKEACEKCGDPECDGSCDEEDKPKKKKLKAKKEDKEEEEVTEESAYLDSMEAELFSESEDDVEEVEESAPDMVRINDVKLAIYEECDAGLITADEKATFLAILDK